MRVSVLASGSSGNATYVQSNGTAVLVDAGISYKRIQKSLSKLGKDVSELDAVLVTHEHSDHVQGLEKIQRHVPVYANSRTGNVLGIQTKTFINEQTMMFGNMHVTPLPVTHDAVDPVGFKITDGRKTVGVFTDFGKANGSLQHVVREANCMVLESNHDIDMLIKGPYPFHLKERILGDKGHCSNIDAGLLVQQHGTRRLKTVFLAHLSRNNNTEEIALDTFEHLVDKTKAIVTSQHHITPLIRV